MMETENDKLQSLQNSVSEDSSAREGGFQQDGSFSARPRQRARIGQRAAYSSDRGSHVRAIAHSVQQRTTANSVQRASVLT